MIANDGTDHTLAQLTLSPTDDASPLKVRAAARPASRRACPAGGLLLTPPGRRLVAAPLVAPCARPLQDACFLVEVPSPLAGHAEYVVHRSRFEASVVAKCWAVGEQCQARGVAACWRLLAALHAPLAAAVSRPCAGAACVMLAPAHQRPLPCSPPLPAVLLE